MSGEQSRERKGAKAEGAHCTHRADPSLDHTKVE